MEPHVVQGRMQLILQKCQLCLESPVIITKKLCYLLYSFVLLLSGQWIVSNQDNNQHSYCMLFNVIISSTLPSSSETFLSNIKSLKLRNFWTVTVKKKTFCFNIQFLVNLSCFAVKCHFLVLFGCVCFKVEQMSCFIFLSNTRHLQSLRYLRANFYLAVAALEIELYGSVYFKEAFIFLSTNNSLEAGRALVSHFYDTKIVHLMIICHY